MRLISAKIKGFRRLKNTKINLDSELISIVGPNEAGKTSLLDVLSSLENDKPFEKSDLTRGMNLNKNNVIIRARFLLNEQERNLINDINAVGEPKWFLLEKHVNGNRSYKLKPKISRNKSKRKKARERLDNLVQMKLVQSYLEKKVEYTDNNNSITIKKLIEKVIKSLNTDKENLSNNIISDIILLNKIFGNFINDINNKVYRTFEITNNLLEELLSIEKEKNPNKILLNKLMKKRPRILLFTENDRNLSSDYNIKKLSNPPGALKNLLDLAEVNHMELFNALKNNNHGKREKIEEDANKKLRNIFKEAWNQYDIYVRFQIESGVFRILIPSADIYSNISERSDGLRSFIALFAFTYLKSGKNQPILLIDEAESHLHYDAQADLINVFEKQNSASQIFYTTHSIGCIPEDYGTSVRVISPILNDEKDTGKSEIKNSFWVDGPGFSPLFFAMGAGILASNQSRKIVYTEGASDLVLLPYLLKQVKDQDKLSFQVAPGLANASRIELQNLSLEAPIVAYFVDGDEAGLKIARRLNSLGVEDNKIINIQSPYTIEDMVNTNIYTKAVNEELLRSHGNQYQFSIDNINSENILDSLNLWCQENSISPPKKVKVAYHIASKYPNEDIFHLDRKNLLLNIYDSIIEALM